MDKYILANQKNWDERTPVHEKSEHYDVQGFLAGKSTLKSVELEELGDIKGKSVLHLQCHFGLDTLSLARLGAEVTGVDLSGKAIALAKKLSKESGVKAKFIQSDISSLQDVISRKFDIVFASYGIFCWISEVDKWMEVAASFLKPGGTLLVVDDHPVAATFNIEFGMEYPYFDSGEAYKIPPQGTYVDRKADLKCHCYQWAHSTGSIINAVIKSGLKMESFNEFSLCGWNRFPEKMEEKDGWYVMKDERLDLPLIFSLKAKK